jgi:hypothetical protein
MKTPPASPAEASSFRRFRFLPSASLLLQTVALFAAVNTLHGAEPAPAAPAAGSSASKVPTPIITSDETVKKNLVDLDHLLDAPGSKLEEILRKNMERIETETAPKIPELELVMKEQPWILPTLKTERHFLLHRYLARRAGGPLLRPDVIALDKFLGENAEIRTALNRDPSQIVQSDFLVAHPKLAEFFGQHPSLSTVLLIPQGGRRGPPKSK